MSGVTDANKLVKQLQRRGPHRVLKGDLGVAGLPGVIYTPENGSNLPAVAFAHDWLTPPKRYAKTLQHLASWGLVVAARTPRAACSARTDVSRSTWAPRST